MATTADNHHIIMRLWLWLSPMGGPVFIAAKTVQKNRQSRIAHDARSFQDLVDGDGW